MSAPACKGTTRAGQPCRAPASVLRPDGYCPAHSPAHAEAFRDASAKGGENKATAVRAEKLVPAHMRPVLSAVLAALHGVRSGTLTPAQGSAIASLAGAAVRVYSAGVLEERIEALEAARAATETREAG